QVALGDRQAGLLEDFQGPLGVAEHQADDGAVGRVDDGDRDDVDVGRLEAADDVGQGADAGGGEDGETAHARPSAPPGGGEVDAAALPLPLTPSTAAHARSLCRSGCAPVYASARAAVNRSPGPCAPAPCGCRCRTG